MIDYPDDDDGAVLAQMAENGVDMSQPLLIEFFVDAPDEEAALAIEQALNKAGYETHVDYDDGEPDEEDEIDPDDAEFGPAWTVYAAVTMPPEYAEIIRIQQELDQLAKPFGGRSDGWGTAIE